jgi:hypothetical protein
MAAHDSSPASKAAQLSSLGIVCALVFPVRSRSTDHVLLKARSLFVPPDRGLLLMDTTWRDAHQSLLATRVRTRDILDIGRPGCGRAPL